MSRKVWIQTFSRLYPNMYIMLVGGPGIGKTLPIEEAAQIFKALGPEYHLAPSSVSAASLSDALNAAKTKIVRPAADPPITEFNSLYVSAEEMSVLLSTYDNEMMARLTRLYDGNLYEERRRGKDIHIVLPNPQLNIIAATTPSYLNEFMPPGAWDQGFISRMVMVYSGERIQRTLFSNSARSESLRNQLVFELGILGQAFGPLRWEPDAAAAMETWHADPKPQPDHVRLVHYNARRSVHVLKLCMISALDRGLMTIELFDFNRALEWLVEAETYMPDLFKAMTSSGDSAVMEEVWQIVYSKYVAERKGLPEHQIIQYLQQRLPYHAVLPCFSLMEKSNMIKMSGPGPNGRGLFTPNPKVDWTY